jgi:hypothetical protein
MSLANQGTWAKYLHTMQNIDSQRADEAGAIDTEHQIKLQPPVGVKPMPVTSRLVTGQP